MLIGSTRIPRLGQGDSYWAFRGVAHLLDFHQCVCHLCTVSLIEGVEPLSVHRLPEDVDFNVSHGVLDLCNCVQDDCSLVADPCISKIPQDRYLFICDVVVILLRLGCRHGDAVDVREYDVNNVCGGVGEYIPYSRGPSGDGRIAELCSLTACNNS